MHETHRNGSLVQVHVTLPQISIIKTQWHGVELIKTLEVLKSEAAEITQKIQTTDTVMREIGEVSPLFPDHLAALRHTPHIILALPPEAMG